MPCHKYDTQMACLQYAFLYDSEVGTFSENTSHRNHTLAVFEATNVLFYGQRAQSQNQTFDYKLDIYSFFPFSFFLDFPCLHLFFLNLITW